MKAVSSAPATESSLGNILEQVAKEKGIEKKVLVETIEAAILKAAQSVFGQNRELESKYNDDTGQVDLFQYMTVVEEVSDPEREIALGEVQRRKLDAELGEELGFQVFWRPEDAKKANDQDKEYGDLLKLKQARSTFGRIAAQTAKQVLLQRVRDAERDLIFEEYKDKKGELIRGIVRRFEKGNNLIVDIGRTEGVLPFREQTPRETYRPGDRIVAYVKEIDREARGPQVILSRSDPRRSTSSRSIATRRATSSPRSSPPRSTRSSSTSRAAGWSSSFPTRSSRSRSVARGRTCASPRSSRSGSSTSSARANSARWKKRRSPRSVRSTVSTRRWRRRCTARASARSKRSAKPAPKSSRRSRASETPRLRSA